MKKSGKPVDFKTLKKMHRERFRAFIKKEAARQLAESDRLDFEAQEIFELILNDPDLSEDKKIHKAAEFLKQNDDLRKQMEAEIQSLMKSFKNQKRGIVKKFHKRK